MWWVPVIIDIIVKREFEGTVDRESTPPPLRFEGKVDREMLVLVPLPELSLRRIRA